MRAGGDEQFGVADGAAVVEGDPVGFDVKRTRMHMRAQVID